MVSFLSCVVLSLVVFALLLKEAARYVSNDPVLSKQAADTLERVLKRWFP